MQGDFMCAEITIPFHFKSTNEVLDLCSFYLWKTGNWRISSLVQQNNAFEKFVEVWQEYKKELTSTFWANVKLWQDTGLLYL